MTILNSSTLICGHSHAISWLASGFDQSPHSVSQMVTCCAPQATDGAWFDYKIPTRTLESSMQFLSRSPRQLEQQDPERPLLSHLSISSSFDLHQLRLMLAPWQAILWPCFHHAILDQQRPLSFQAWPQGSWHPQHLALLRVDRMSSVLGLRLAVYYMIKDKEAFADVSSSDLLGPFFKPFSKAV